MKIFRSKAGHTSDKPRIVTDQESKAAAVEQLKYNKRSVWVAAIGIVVSAMITIGLFALDKMTDHQQTEQSSPTSPQPSSSEHPATSPTTETAPASTDENSAQAGSPVSGCYDGDTPTPCDSPHSREVFAKPAGSPCDASALILYMGGVPGVDLLASGIDAKPLENTEDRCVVERPSGMPHVSLKDIWTSDNDHNGYKDGGEFRRCFTRQGQATSCDADHASEEFYDAPEEVDCGKKYEDFSGRPVDRNIRVTRQPRDHRIVCRAEVQVSTDRLTASVRDLENATLPIKQN
ncbi:hypothetical protein BKH13_12710 [Actinomyces naeslundii]|uniref:Septum formation-related domain-containing protein n=2 Tax=Actinomyces naeslundii TaxID=1655 RepID=A0ABX3EVU5_ACTNA|nr:hypothetical protein BKH13_12710 [Actinomyces naeslundii]OLO82540.1 hypothetical protein BKH11_12630 [Actinomyces naeslundii]OLO86931.1 hypothetical protein BKH12_00915 [Actinomyces naeslundii]OMG10690.1 hypothetical protein BKH08_07315 [Actinomyces naeslundii]